MGIATRRVSIGDRCRDTVRQLSLIGAAICYGSTAEGYRHKLRQYRSSVSPYTSVIAQEYRHALRLSSLIGKREHRHTLRQYRSYAPTQWDLGIHYISSTHGYHHQELLIQPHTKPILHMDSSTISRL
eukprot:2365250-Rhodomonas_salina.3